MINFAFDHQDVSHLPENLKNTVSRNATSKWQKIKDFPIFLGNFRMIPNKVKLGKEFD